MQNILLRIAYEGTDFCGYQEQPEKRTIAGTLRTAVERVTGRATRLVAAGRTDRGVHAEDQAINFLTALTWQPETFCRILQNQLPPDIRIRSAKSVPISFHARFIPHITTYRYTVENGPLVLPTERRTVFSYTYPLNFEALKTAVKCFEGEHDFSAFSAASPYRSTHRHVLHAEVTRFASRYIFSFSAESFLQYQVRMMVGTALLAGRGKVTKDDILSTLSGKYAHPIAFSAEAKGLVLESIQYENKE